MHRPPRFNAAEYFVERHLIEGRGEATAIRFGQVSFTYADICQKMHQAAYLLDGLGVQTSDRVLILLPDSPPFAVFFWAALKIGALAVPANTFLSADKLALLLEDSIPRCIITTCELLNKIRPAMLRIWAGQLNQISVLLADLESKPNAGEAPFEVRPLEPALAQYPPAGAPTREHPGEVALLLYTSGSTGEPKATVHRHRDLLACVQCFGRHVLQISAADRCFSVSKLFFAFGLGNSLTYPFGVGAETVFVPERINMERVFETLRCYRPTILFAVPTLFAGMLRFAEASRADFASVRCAVSAGEALPAKITDQFERQFGIQLLDGIGTTEMMHTFISNVPGRIRPGSSGRLVPGYEIKIVDDSGNESEAGEIGNLWVRGASAATGYWNSSEQTCVAFRGEWVVTGDKYRCDGDGYYWHSGRVDDMLKVNGLWVSPVEIESALLEHPTVKECAVVGCKDSGGFEKPRAHIVLHRLNTPSDRHGQQALQTELCEFLLQRLSAHKVPVAFVLAAELPRTETGKLQRNKLRESDIRGLGDDCGDASITFQPS